MLAMNDSGVDCGNIIKKYVKISNQSPCGTQTC